MFIFDKLITKICILDSFLLERTQKLTINIPRVIWRNILSIFLEYSLEKKLLYSNKLKNVIFLLENLKKIKNKIFFNFKKNNENIQNYNLIEFKNTPLHFFLRLQTYKRSLYWFSVDKSHVRNKRYIFLENFRINYINEIKCAACSIIVKNYEIFYYIDYFNLAISNQSFKTDIHLNYCKNLISYSHFCHFCKTKSLSYHKSYLIKVPLRYNYLSNINYKVFSFYYLPLTLRVNSDITFLCYFKQKFNINVNLNIKTSTFFIYKNFKIKTFIAHTLDNLMYIQNFNKQKVVIKKILILTKNIKKYFTNIINKFLNTNTQYKNMNLKKLKSYNIEIFRILYNNTKYLDLHYNS